jgi:hypothetical protein
VGEEETQGQPQEQPQPNYEDKVKFRTAYGNTKRKERDELTEKLGLDKIKDVAFDEILRGARLVCYKCVMLELHGELLPKRITDRVDSYMKILSAMEKAAVAKKLSDKSGEADAARLLAAFEEQEKETEQGGGD